MTCAYTQIGHWLTELNNIQGASLTLNAEGYCRMMSESGFELTLLAEESSKLFRILIDVLPMPDHNQTHIYQKCLSLNLDQGFTGGASIAIDIPGHSIVLSFIREIEITTFTEFSNLLQNLLIIANDVKSELIQESQTEQSTDNVPKDFLLPV